MTIVFTTSDDYVSRVVRRLDSAEVSHVAIGVTLLGVALLVHATFGGVKISHRAKWLRKNRVVREFKPLIDLGEGLSHAIDCIDEAYGYGALFGFAWVIAVGRWMGRKIRNPLSSPRTYICSELVRSVDMYDRVPEWKLLDPENVRPKQLDDACRISPHFELLPQ